MADNLIAERRGYVPRPKRERNGIALCLSGGGYRAALFHLGALRRLNELGILSQVTTISSVSGGSILAAHLAQQIPDWPLPGATLPDWQERVVTPFKRFTSRNIRTGPLLKRLLPVNWLRSSTAVEALAQQYEGQLTTLRLAELPVRPSFVFCATDMAYGVNWEFRRGRVGDYQAGYLSPSPDWPLARAVAASSCFPPMFGPLRVALPPSALRDGMAEPGPKRDRVVARLGLSDGGVYDNMALEPVWKDAAVVLVSDGGATFSFETDTGVVWRLRRYTSIVSRQASGVRKRWLISQFVQGEMSGTYWGIGSATGDYAGVGGYSQALVKDVIARVRTDLDSFSKPETAVLENHGYLLAEAAIGRHLPSLASPRAIPCAVPNPDWMDEQAVRRALIDSAKRKLLLGRR